MNPLRVAISNGTPGHHFIIVVARGNTIKGKTLSLLAMLTDEMEDQKLRNFYFFSVDVFFTLRKNIHS